MAIFGKNKKKDSLQALTEEGIQKKLYGTYKKGNAKLLNDDHIIEEKRSPEDDANTKQEHKTYIGKSVSVFDRTVSPGETTNDDVANGNGVKTTSLLNIESFKFVYFL